MISKVKHETKPQMRESVAAQFATLKKMEEDLQLAKANLQNMVGAYVLGADLPSNISFDEEYNILYEVEVPDEEKAPENYGVTELSDSDPQAYDPEEYEEVAPKKVVRRM